MRRTLLDYAAELRSLLPQGFAWTRDPDSILGRLLLSLASAPAAAESLLWDLLAESDPRTATALLSDWERVLGLPDACLSREGMTLSERRDAAATRLVMTGGASRAYFAHLARTLLQQEVVIEEFRPFRAGRSRAADALTNDAWTFVWRARAACLPAPIRFRAGRSQSGNPLVRHRMSSLECLFRRLKPAHTHVLFLFGSEA